MSDAIVEIDSQRLGERRKAQQEYIGARRQTRREQRRKRREQLRADCDKLSSQQCNCAVLSNEASLQCCGNRRADPCAVQQVKVCQGPVALSGQSEVDQFGAMQCTEVVDFLFITDAVDDPVVDLRPLSSLRRVRGQLALASCNELASLTGFECLQRVQTLIINDCAVESTAALQRLKIIDDRLEIIQNSLLKQIDGFERLQKVGSILVEDNPLLSTIQAFKCRLSVFESIAINDNASLTKLDTFNNLQTTQDINVADNENLRVLKGFGGPILGLSTVRVVENQQLRSIDAFNDVQVAAATISINEHESLPVIEGFEQLLYCNAVTIIGNAVLTRVDGFRRLQRVANTINVNDNPLLTSVDGFATVTIIDDALFVSENASLASVDGLIGLRFARSLFLMNGDNLIDVSAFSGLCSQQQIASTVRITNNSLLADFCGLQPLADSSPATETPNFTISGNAANPTKEEIAALQPCNARTFFERVIARFLIERTVTKAAACVLTHNLTKRTICCLVQAKTLGKAQGNVLLTALAVFDAQRCLLPPIGAPLTLPDSICCENSKLDRYALFQGCVCC